MSWQGLWQEVVAAYGTWATLPAIAGAALLLRAASGWTAGQPWRRWQVGLLLVLTGYAVLLASYDPWRNAWYDMAWLAPAGQLANWEEDWPALQALRFSLPVITFALAVGALRLGTRARRRTSPSTGLDQPERAYSAAAGGASSG